MFGIAWAASRTDAKDKPSAICVRTSGVSELDLKTLGGWTDLRMVQRYTQAATAEMALRAHRQHSPVALIMAAVDGGGAAI